MSNTISSDDRHGPMATLLIWLHENAKDVTKDRTEQASQEVPALQQASLSPGSVSRVLFPGKAKNQGPRDDGRKTRQGQMVEAVTARRQKPGR